MLGVMQWVACRDFSACGVLFFFFFFCAVAAVVCCVDLSLQCSLRVVLFGRFGAVGEG